MRAALLAMLVAAAPAAAHAQALEGISVFAGYRFGGELTDVTTGESWETSEGPAYALAFDFAIDRQRQYQLIVSHRNSALQATGFFSPVGDIELGIAYIQFGGVYHLEEVGRGPYAVGGVGLTHMNPKQGGFSSETGFSLNLGFGYTIPLGKGVGLKFEGRGYATLISGSSALFCSGGCVVQIKGDSFTQGEVMAGIAVRF
jgi:hypothetical protein